jgi:hypothetical protein
MADSLAMTARSSAAVLHARTCRMRSRNLSDMIVDTWSDIYLLFIRWGKLLTMMTTKAEEI